MTGIKQSVPVFKKSSALKVSIIFLLVFIAGMKLYLPHYWINEYPPLLSTIDTGLTEDGHPWIGSRNPELTIKEFTDYQCFQCGKLHHFLRELVEKYPDKIRLIHYNYPLDHRYNPVLGGKPFHVGAGELALLAIYAANRGKFWQMNDELYRFVQTSHSQSLNLNMLAEKLSLPLTELQDAVHSLVFLNKLRMDIRLGIKSGITATPAYIINDHVYIGSIPASVLQDFIP